MTRAPRRGPRAAVYARLRDEVEVRRLGRTPPRGTRVVGWLLVLLIGATVVFTALRASPW